MRGFKGLTALFLIAVIFVAQIFFVYAFAEEILSEDMQMREILPEDIQAVKAVGSGGAIIERAGGRFISDDSAEWENARGIGVFSFSGAGESQANPAATAMEINDAVNNAQSGDTVWIAPGNYTLEAALTINKNLYLTSTSQEDSGELAVLTCAPNRRHITVTAAANIMINFDNVQLRGLRTDANDEDAVARQGGGIRYIPENAPGNAPFTLTLYQNFHGPDAPPTITRVMVSSQPEYAGNMWIGGTGLEGNGGAVFTTNSVRLVDMALTENLAAKSGGAVSRVTDLGNSPANGTIAIQEGRYDYNRATGEGLGGAISGISAANPGLSINADVYTYFRYNRGRQGGAINFDGNIYITSQIVRGNHPTVFSNNTATVSGGAINVNGSLKINGGGIFSNNSAAVSGGAIEASSESGTVDIYDGDFTENIVRAGTTESFGGGGGAISAKGYLKIINAYFGRNSLGTSSAPSYGQGGAIVAQGGLYIADVHLYYNSTYGRTDNINKNFGAGNGGAIYCYSLSSTPPNVTIEWGGLGNNTARGAYTDLKSGNGGAIFIRAGGINQLTRNFAQKHLSDVHFGQGGAGETPSNSAVRRYNLTDEDRKYVELLNENSMHSSFALAYFNNDIIGYYGGEEILPDYTVNYHSNNLSGLVYSETLNSGSFTVKDISDAALSAIKNSVPAGSRVVKWSTAPNGSGTDYEFGDTPAAPENGGTINLYAVIEEITTVDILTPSGDGYEDFSGFRILRGRWYNEYESKVTYLVRVNEKSNSTYIKSVIGNFTITGVSSNGFENIDATNVYTKLMTVDGLGLTADNVGNEIDIDGTKYCEISFNITNTLKSGIADFTLSYTENSKVLATGVQTALIPGDVDKEAKVGSSDHTLIYNYMKTILQSPLRLAAGGYVFELADINKDGRISTSDHTLVYNMYMDNIPSN
jgi:predicted outer membrane repeat protein